MLMPPKQQGSILIEALISILIFSMGILSLVGLQSALSKNSSDNQYRAQAMLIAQAHLANMASFGVSANQYVNTVDRALVQRQLPNGQIFFLAGNNSLYTVTVSWRVPGSLQRNIEVSSYIYNPPKT